MTRPLPATSSLLTACSQFLIRGLDKVQAAVESGRGGRGGAADSPPTGGAVQNKSHWLLFVCFFNSWIFYATKRFWERTTLWNLSWWRDGDLRSVGRLCLCLLWKQSIKSPPTADEFILCIATLLFLAEVYLRTTFEFVEACQSFFRAKVPSEAKICHQYFNFCSCSNTKALREIKPFVSPLFEARCWKKKAGSKRLWLLTCVKRQCPLWHHKRLISRAEGFFFRNGCRSRSTRLHVIFSWWWLTLIVLKEIFSEFTRDIFFVNSNVGVEKSSPDVVKWLLWFAFTEVFVVAPPPLPAFSLQKSPLLLHYRPKMDLL